MCGVSTVVCTLEERRQITVAQCSAVAHLAEHRTQLVPVRCRRFDDFQCTEVAQAGVGSVATAAAGQLHTGDGTERLADKVLVELVLRPETGAVTFGNT